MPTSSILIVDDNQTILTIASSLLKSKFKVFPSLSAGTALTILERIPIDLILLDIEMPEINGLDFLKLLKSSERHRDIPVVIMTGDSGEGIYDWINGVKAAGCIKKPLEAASFTATVENYLSRA